jgi:2',3'-cyclic-nucleotide 2'-phosphodiesterase (5'-nucleotidase family)
VERFSRENKKYAVQAFASDVDRHMREHGMDSVFYIEDDSGAMVNILQHYSKFTNGQVQDKIKVLYDTLYDDFDKDNASWSATFLLNSIDAQMRKDILPLCQPIITGPELWM